MSRDFLAIAFGGVYIENMSIYGMAWQKHDMFRTTVIKLPCFVARIVVSGSRPDLTR